MITPENAISLTLTILGPTFVFGFLLGWFLSLVHLDGSSSGPSRHHRDE